MYIFLCCRSIPEPWHLATRMRSVGLWYRRREVWWLLITRGWELTLWANTVGHRHKSKGDLYCGVCWTGVVNCTLHCCIYCIWECGQCDYHLVPSCDKTPCVGTFRGQDSRLKCVILNNSLPHRYHSVHRCSLVSAKLASSLDICPWCICQLLSSWFSVE